MDQQQLQEFKTLFKDLRKNYLMNDFNLTGELSDPQKGDEVDQIVEERDKALLLKLKGRQDFFLKKVQQAEERIHNGSFGECLECGDDISLERLRARPTATQCISCKEEQERVEHHVRYEKKSHTHGKTFQNSNITPITSKESHKNFDQEKVLKFNKERIRLNRH